MDISSRTPVITMPAFDQSQSPQSSREVSGTGKHVIQKDPDPITGLGDEKKPMFRSIILETIKKKRASSSTKADTTLDSFVKVVRSCSKLDVWPFIFGMPILAGTAGLSGAFINYQFRKILLLAEHGRVTSFIALGVVPISSTILTHGTFVTDHMVKYPNKCVICVQIRGAVSQVGLAVVYPFILAPLLALPISKKLARYSVPKLTRKNIPAVLTYIRELVSPLKTKMMGLIAINLLLGMGITMAEQYAYYKHVRPGLIREAELKAQHLERQHTVPTSPDKPRSVIVH